METSHGVDDAAAGEPALHEQAFTLAELRLEAEYPFANGWAAALMLPVRMLATRIDFSDAQGRPLPDGDDIHHRDQTLTGLGDPWLRVRHARAAGRLSLDGFAGVTLPLGRTEENPFELGAMERVHEHVQFGTGTVNPLVGASCAVRFERVTPSVWAMAQLVLYENGGGFRAGNRYSAGVTAVSGLGLADWRFRLGAMAQAEQAERWDGEVPLDDGNQGRVDVLADVGASLRFGDGWSANLGAKVPVLTHVVGGQLEYPVIVEAGVTATFEIGGHEVHHGHGHEDEHGHEHGHAEHADGHGHAEHGDEHEGATGLDVAEIAPNGEAVELSPVPGRITVFDFWASWCAPCHVLEGKLLELMRRHPERIAVRKLRVETWDVPAAVRYLVGAPTLPYVKVFGADGVWALDASGDPEAIAGRIEELLHGAEP